MRSKWLVALAVIVALAAAPLGAQVAQVSSRFVGGALVYYNASGSEIARFDGVNRSFIVANATSAGAGTFSIRKRFTVAEVNAGATLVAAVTGYKIRMVDCKAISVGGAAGATTTVDILGTVSTARKLVAFAQASLTQSAVLTSGGSGAAVLADGASYTTNDVSTAVTIGITGASVTVATHIDVIFTYALEV